MKDCLHRLVKIEDLEYRYQCVICGQKLKIASGVIIPEKSEVGT